MVARAGAYVGKESARPSSQVPNASLYAQEAPSAFQVIVSRSKRLLTVDSEAGTAPWTLYVLQEIVYPLRTPILVAQVTREQQAVQKTVCVSLATVFPQG